MTISADQAQETTRSRSGAAIRTWVSSLAFTAVTMFAGFFVTPLVFAVLREERSGLVRTLTETFAYLTLVGQGITVALVPLVASAFGRGDRTAGHRALGVGLRAYALAALGITALGLAMTPVLASILHVPPAARPEMRVAWAIAVAGVPLMMFTPLRIVFDVTHRGYLLNLMMTAQGVLTAVLSVALVWAGWGVPGMMFASLAASVLFYALLGVFFARLYPGLASEVLRARPTRGDWRMVLGLSGPTLVAMLGERVGVLSDSIVLSGVMGTKAAFVLFVTQRLASLGQTVLNAISSAIWPALAEMHARGELERFNHRLVELTRLVVVLGIAGLAPVVAYNHHFVARWIGPDEDAGRWVVIVAAINAVALSLTMIFSSALVSTGQVRRLAGPAAASAALNLLASLAFTRLLGLIGPLLGTLVATMTIGVWYLPHQLRRSFRTPRRELAWAVLAPLCWGIPWATALSALADAHDPPGWAGLFGEMALGAIAYLAFGWAVILSSDDRLLWKERLIAPILRRRYA